MPTRRCNIINGRRPNKTRITKCNFDILLIGFFFVVKPRQPPEKMWPNIVRKKNKKTQQRYRYCTTIRTYIFIIVVILSSGVEKLRWRRRWRWLMSRRRRCSRAHCTRAYTYIYLCVCTCVCIYTVLRLSFYWSRIGTALLGGVKSVRPFGTRSANR